MIRSTIQQILIECLLCAWLCSCIWENQTDRTPAFMGFSHCWEKQSTHKISDSDLKKRNLCSNLRSFPHSSAGKKSACNAGDLGSIPGLGRSPGEGNGNPLQYSCLENSMDRAAWWATVHGVARVGHDWATRVTILSSYRWYHWVLRSTFWMGWDFSYHI